MLWKTGHYCSHDIKSFAIGSFLDGTCIVIERANDYLCYKNIKNAGQIIAKPIDVPHDTRGYKNKNIFFML